MQDSPLALCDARTIDKDDLIEADRVIPGRAGEVYYLLYNEGQRWVCFFFANVESITCFIDY